MLAKINNQPLWGRPRRSRASWVMGLAWFFLASVAGGQESNSTGYTDSGGFALDTQDVQNLGFAESGGFTLDTGAVQGLATPGTAVSSGFVLDTQGSVNSAPVDLNQTGFADSGGFTVDTSNGTASPADSNQSGFEDSGGFAVDTQDPNPSENTGHNDSSGFTLDTGGDDGSGQTAHSDSGGFGLDTRDNLNPATDPDATGFEDSGGFALDTNDANGNLPVTNAPPTDLNSTAPLSIDENQPVGTFVGEFIANDPDANTTLTYYFINGSTENNNSLFTLESNGTLKTAIIFDYENNSSSYTISLKVKDQQNASVEGNFTVLLTDLYEMPPNTPPTDLNSTAPLYIAENQPVGTFVGEFNATDDALATSFILDPNDQNPSPPNAYEHGNVDSTDDTFYTGQTNLSRWTSTLDVGKDNGTITVRLNAGSAAERLYIKQGTDHIIFDTSWWKTAGSANSGDYDQFTIQYSPGVPTKYSFVTLDTDMDGNNGNAAYHTRSGASVFNFNGDPIVTLPGIANENSISIVVESATLFSAEATYQLPLQYSLVSGSGDTHNELFSLDSNGTLTTATIFDYENNASSYSIRIQARDDHNKTVEDNFMVTLTDAYEPEENATITGTVTYNGMIPGPAYVWANDAYGAKVAEDILPDGNGSYSLSVPKGAGYDFKVFIDGTGDGYPQAHEVWKHHEDWNSSLGGFNLTQVDGNLSGINFNLFDSDHDSDGFSNWQEHLAGTNQNESNSTPPLEFGMLAHWTFDETNGTILHDSSGNDLNGTLIGFNNPWSPGRNGGSLRFDGVDDHITFAGITALNDVRPISFSGWLKLDLNGSGYVFAKRSLEQGYWRFFASGPTKNWLVRSTTNSPPSLLSSEVTPFFHWQHIALTWNGLLSGQNTRLYIDGAEKTSITRDAGSGQMISDADNLFTLGNRPQNNSSFFKGWMDDFRMWNRVITHNEIQALYHASPETNATISGNITNTTTVPGPIILWVYDESGTKVVQQTLSGGPGPYSFSLPVGHSYDIKAFTDGNQDGELNPEIGEPYTHFGNWNGTGHDLLPVDGNQSNVHLALSYETDQDNDGYSLWEETQLGTSDVNASSFPVIALTDANFQDAVNLWFTAESNATSTYGHISDWNVSQVTDMSEAFRDRSSFDANITAWDVSNATSMDHMFANASSFNQPIGNWEVSAVTNMNYLFAGSMFNQPVGDWNVSSVTNMAGMFANTPFNQPIGDWDVSSVTKMDRMFKSAAPFNQPIEDWDVSSVTEVQEMFKSSSFDQPIGDWNVSSVTNMAGMFANSPFNQPIGDWDVSSVTKTDWMFSDATAFSQPLDDWNVSAVTNMENMFRNLVALSDSNKGKIHTTFSSNPNWNYDWSVYVSGAYQSPTGGYQSPDTGYQSPNNGYQTPDSGYQTPGDHYQSPTNGYQSPDGNYSTPNDGYPSPDNGYQSPDTGYQSPDHGYQTPDSGYQTPGDHYDSPNDGYESPDGNYYPPNDGYPSPDNGYQSPNDGYQSPGYGYQTPDTGYQSPNDHYHSPHEGYISPGSGYQTPSGEYQSPDGVPFPINDPDETPPEEEPIFPAIVRTFPADMGDDGAHLFHGQILADGGSTVTETGFLLSRRIFLSDSIRLVAAPDTNIAEFFASTNDLIPDTTYYFRAFAVNGAGESRGALKKFRTPKQVDPNDWQKGAVKLADGWKTLNWLGTYRDTGHIWIYHTEMDWLYPSAMEDGSVWLWSQDNGWLWTTEGVFPHFFQHDSANWIYFMGKINGWARFYDYSSQSVR